MSSTSDHIRVAQIGYGYWGPNLLRNLQALPSVEVCAVGDINPQQLVKLSRSSNVFRTTTAVEELLDDPTIDAIVIATPAASHFELTYRALTAGKHALVEKPLAMTAADGARLVKLAEENGLVLLVGHTFLYNTAVRRLKQYLEEGELGDVFYLYSQRLNLGRVRQDVNALWNFAPHDISIILYLLEQTPEEVSARGFCCLQQGIEDVVFMTLAFRNGMGAHVHISWMDPQKVRRMTVVGSRKMAVYDDVSTDAKIKIYDRGVERIPNSESPRDFQTFAEFQLLPRRGDIVIPALDFPEPLQLECQHFIDCILEGKRPLTDGQHGLDVVRVLEAAQHSLEKLGLPQRIEQ